MTYEKALERVNDLLKYAATLDTDNLDVDFNDTVAMHMACKKTLEKQIPKHPIHIHKVYPKHDWIRDDDGEIDLWVMDVGYHNGPMCKRCHVSVCEHCNPDYDEEECVVDEHRCPSCNEEVHYYYDTDKFCRNCGQALDWGELE